MSKSFLSANFINREKKNSNAIFQFSHINYILTNYSDFEFLRKFLNVVLNDKILTQIEHNLKRCSCTKTFYVMFYLKKRYRNFIDESVKIMKQSLKTKEKRKKIKKIYWRKITEFIKKNHNFQKHFINVLRRITSITFNENDVKRSVKMFDSSLFSNEKIMSIFQWIIKMKNKLFVNANYFDTKKLKMMYVLSRTKNFAAKHLNFRTREKSFFLFLLSKNMFVILKEMFNDFNKKLTIINEFRALHIKIKNFYIFWAKFQRISFGLNYVDDVFMTKIIHKLYNRIQRFIAIVFKIKNIYELTHKFNVFIKIWFNQIKQNVSSIK